MIARLDQDRPGLAVDRRADLVYSRLSRAISRVGLRFQLGGLGDRQRPAATTRSAALQALA